MAEQTKIEWCDATFNPWMGCTKVGPGCDHCYAEISTPSRTRGIKWGPGAQRQRTSHSNWRQVGKWNRDKFYQCQSCGWRGDARSARIIDAIDVQYVYCGGCDNSALAPARRRVFCASLADWLDNEVPIDWLVDLLHLIWQTPNLDWLLLTKRIGNLRTRISAAHAHHGTTIARSCECEPLSYASPFWGWLYQWMSMGEPPANVWIGATVVNQAEADRDVPKLLQVPARVRFLSIEPMLGPIEFSNVTKRSDAVQQLGKKALDGIHWIIVGGESGHHARAMHPHWIMSLRDQCAAAGVPLLFKQWGEWAPRSNCYHTREDGSSFADADPGCERWSTIRLTEAGHDGRQLEHVDGGCDAYMQRVGKKLAGNLLQGRHHLEWPNHG